MVIGRDKRLLYLLAPIEPREAEAWRDSSHSGVVAAHAGSEAEARRAAASAFSRTPESPWLDPALSVCFRADKAGGSDAPFYAAKARLKSARNPLPDEAVPVAGGDGEGPGAFTAAAPLDDAARQDYIAAALDAERGLRAEIDPRAFLGQAADATILSYPKSGKTWVAYLVTQYIARYLGFREAFEEWTGAGGLRTFAPESRRGYLGAVAARRTPQRWAPLIRFMHQDSLGYPYFAPKTLGAPGTARHILLIRDPRDVLVSHFHHIVVKNKGVFDAHRDKPHLAPDTEIGEFIRSDFLGIRHLLAYCAGWGRWAAETGAPVVYYEDLVAEPERSLAALLRHLGVSDVEDELVREAVEAAAFDRLRSAESSAKRDSGKADDASSRRMRRGKAGGYVDELGAEDVAYLGRVMERADVPILRRYLAS